ncbi:cytosine deaminase/metal dependent hydrolase [Micromonas pusilla CCMP1545]|mgnify:CR=1 FL=1|jgi:cytosine/creatinine deaminase|uniref:Cytosine deaminase/metal dependent hydrolase n=1 Tax=Micromonas pusilla (strain CCMP1545) TaxID=564608 RepID=C1MRN5_MICPC|nr:cytosine deaminase/metal dependent hydrolase [Micromonas pusilla CCMP1545]EEH57360.1 cytosine deaminase/metal dependent hydrolase [Micromonas pusilla CCMP1545]|mmetsp:Transcript_10515/g.38126  ORF Transcript_10515/g.38126 Transcript_10515/m.38126 type:complete len:482 (-) Transcript_10515:155-1600(-)|eukprot:XP_003058905.1 cytosine deaminase/metal dependent hydrolase [Micromonas pusilla CCMP1545]
MSIPSAPWSSWLPNVPSGSDFVLRNAHVPACCVHGAGDLAIDHDGLSFVDIEIRTGKVSSVTPASSSSSISSSTLPQVDVDGGMVFPTFVDLHTHIDKGHTCERSRNQSGSLAGADDSCAKDERHWTKEDVYTRMEFSLKCAYAHGTSAIRTHLMSNATQGALVWPVFKELREKWKGRIELQGVALTILRFFRDETEAAKLADLVKKNGGILGAAVSCTDRGGYADDVYTTCLDDMDALLDTVFRLAKERDLDLDFHVDENGNEASKGLLHIARASARNAFTGRVVCGHCCSLAAQSPGELHKICLEAKKANITVVSLPIVNQWLQNRDVRGISTPTRRGVTTMKELDDAGVSVCLASDNTRDQFYGYGDLDMLEIFGQGCKIGHLDRPISHWPLSVTSRPANVMGLGDAHGRVVVGGVANLVVFRGRRYSEILSRPQHDRLVLRDGRPLPCGVPDYRELDDMCANGMVGSGGVKRGRGGA